jgi:hypothetical protein
LRPKSMGSPSYEIIGLGMVIGLAPWLRGLPFLESMYVIIRSSENANNWRIVRIKCHARCLVLCQR